MPTVSSHIRRFAPSLSDSEGNALRVASHPVPLMPTALMCGHSRPTALRPRLETSQGPLSRRGIRRGSCFATSRCQFTILVNRRSLFPSSAEISNPSALFVRQTFIKKMLVGTAEIIKTVICKPRIILARKGIQFGVNFCFKVCHLSLQSRAGLPLRWTGYRANCPSLSTAILRKK